MMRSPEKPHTRHDSLKLVGVSVDVQGMEINFEREGVIGRDHTCDAVVESRSVSRRHARVYQQGGGWWIEDLNSTNKVHVDGVQLDRSKLRDGCMVNLSRTVSFAVQINAPNEKKPRDQQQPTPARSVYPPSSAESSNPYSWFGKTQHEPLDVTPHEQPEPVSIGDETLTDEALSKILAQARRPSAMDKVLEKSVYEGHSFAIRYPSTWQPHTVYTFRGPDTEGLVHTMTINRLPFQAAIDLATFTDWQVRSKEHELQGYRLLLNKEIYMSDGTQARKNRILLVAYGRTSYISTSSFCSSWRCGICLNSQFHSKNSQNHRAGYRTDDAKLFTLSAL